MINGFKRYQYSFPELYESHNLEEFATERISDFIRDTKELMNTEPQFVEEILKRWELLS